MPLVNCRECKKEVSHEADVCPACGIPYPSKKRWQTRRIIQASVLALLIGACLGGYFYHESGNKKEAEALHKKTDTLTVEQKIVAPDDRKVVKNMIDSGKSALRISKETGLSWKEVKKIKKEKREEEKHKN